MMDSNRVLCVWEVYLHESARICKYPRQFTFSSAAGDSFNQLFFFVNKSTSSMANIVRWCCGNGKLLCFFLENDNNREKTLLCWWFYQFFKSQKAPSAANLIPTTQGCFLIISSQAATQKGCSRITFSITSDNKFYARRQMSSHP